MVARLRSWWQIIKQHRLTILVVAIILIVAIGLIIVGYRFDWTGFNGKSKSGKTLWDWMQLLFIPVVLAVAGFWFNHRERKAAELRAENERKAAELRSSAEREIEQQRAQTERDIAEDNQRESSLQAYINEMSELLLEKQLRESQPEDEVRKIARVRTLTVLPRLNANRKRFVLQFLYEADLIDKNKRIIELFVRANLRGMTLVGANLEKAYLTEADLERAKLDRANLAGAYFGWANLTRANLCDAILHKVYLARANLCDASMERADLREADLWGANLSNADLRGVNLNGAKYNIKTHPVEDDQGKSMTDALGNPVILGPTRWPQGFNPNAEGAKCTDC
jgi:uncharacterized protein YjbI with pentapeptide repeats